MSISSSTVILSRATAATHESPLALFKTSCGRIDCVFGATISAKKRKEFGVGYIGDVHRGWHREDILSLLIGAADGAA